MEQQEWSLTTITATGSHFAIDLAYQNLQNNTINNEWWILGSIAKNEYLEVFELKKKPTQIIINGSGTNRTPLTQLANWFKEFNLTGNITLYNPEANYFSYWGFTEGEKTVEINADFLSKPAVECLGEDVYLDHYVGLMMQTPIDQVAQEHADTLHKLNKLGIPYTRIFDHYKEMEKVLEIGD